MALWIWFLSVGGTFFFMVYGVHAAQMKSRRHDVRHELLLGKQKAPDARSPASSLRINPLRDISRESRQAPSSMYHGHEWFFDSVEHRDMFEANQHEPVTKDSDCSPRRSNKAGAYSDKEATGNASASGSSRHRMRWPVAYGILIKGN